STSHHSLQYGLVSDPLYFGVSSPPSPNLRWEFGTDRQQLVNETIGAAKTSLENDAVRSALGDIERLVGTHLNKTADRLSIFFDTAIASTSTSPETRTGWRATNCQAAWDEGKRTELTLPTNETINRCADKKEELLAYITSTKYVQDVKFALLDALNIVISTFIISFHYDFHNGEPLPDLPQDQDKFLVYMAPFQKMFQEVWLLDMNIHVMIKSTKRKAESNDPDMKPGPVYWEYVFNQTYLKKLATPKYLELWLGTRDYGTALDDLTKKVAAEFITGSNNWEAKYNQWRADYSTFSEKEFEEFRTNAEKLWEKNFRADLLNPEDPPHLYDWRSSNENRAIFNMNLAWDRLDEAYEELKCYHVISYEQLRPTTLKKTQRDLKTAELFNGSSITLGQPCVNTIIPDNDTLDGLRYYDLTTPSCTLENNEICAPRPLSHGCSERILLMENAKGIGPGSFNSPLVDVDSEWIVETIWKQISCPSTKGLEDRRQCRGSVGYPCRTLPLAPGKHNESCVSEYCDMEENSCEDRPWFRRRSGAMASPYRTLASSYWMMNMMILMIAL
ncbi:hypothetical protein Ocin01_18608, partial [Orchesella cincta]